jgi:hypothetical protein
MDIKSFTPQTQSFLARMDYNRDEKLSARELGLLAKVPSVPGIEPQDLAVIQAELKKAKGPSTIIVSLVDEAHLPPGYKSPEPLFSEGSPAQASGTKIRTKAVKSDTTGDSAGAKKKGGLKADASPFSLKATPKAGKKDGEPGTEVQATAQLGDLKIQGTPSFDSDGLFTGAKLKAGVQIAPSLGLSVGVGTVDSKKASSTGKPGQAPAPEPAPVPNQYKLDGQADLGLIKVNASGRVNTESALIDKVSTGVEVELLKGHSISAETVPVSGSQGAGINWSSVELGSSHTIAEGLSLTTKYKPADAKNPNGYGAGFRYKLGSNFSLDGSASTRKETLFTTPLDTARTLDYKAGFRYKVSF